MKLTSRGAVALLVVLLGSTAESGAESALAAVNCAPQGELRGDVTRGSALHVRHCAECHGADGKAEVIVMHMDVPPKDQSDPAYMKTLPDSFLYLAICRGGESVGRNFIMPAWGDLLSDQDIKDLVAHIRTFSGT